MMTQQDLERYFVYLDTLRSAGTTNMYFGSPAFLVSQFALSRQDACYIVALWMRAFDPAQPVAQRARRALKAPIA